MDGKFAVRIFLALATIPMAAGAALGQDGGGPGVSHGFGDHRPPMERAFRFDGTHGQFWNNPRIVEKLKLTDEQRKEMDAILLEHRGKLIDLRATEEKAELEMQPLMSADEPNETAILAQIDKIASARAELEKANARFLLALRAKLTPEQWKEVREFREHPPMDRGEWGHRPGMNGGDGHMRGQEPPQPPDGAPAPPQGGPSGDEQ